MESIEILEVMHIVGKLGLSDFINFMQILKLEI